MYAMFKFSIICNFSIQSDKITSNLYIFDFKQSPWARHHLCLYIVCHSFSWIGSAPLTMHAHKLYRHFSNSAPRIAILERHNTYSCGQLCPYCSTVTSRHAWIRRTQLSIFGTKWTARIFSFGRRTLRASFLYDDKLYLWSLRAAHAQDSRFWPGVPVGPYRHSCPIPQSSKYMYAHVPF